MVRSNIWATLIVLIALLALPASAFGQANTNVTLNVTLSPPDTSPTGSTNRITAIRYNLLRNGVSIRSATQPVTGSGPNYTYTWPIPSTDLAPAGTYVIVAYPMTDGLLARYQGTGQVTAPAGTVTPILAVPLSVPFRLPGDSAGDVLLLAAGVLLVIGGGMWVLRRTRLARAGGLA